MEDFDGHVSVNSDLAGQSEFTENAVFFEACSFDFAHRWLFAQELHGAGGASCVSAAAVGDIYSAVFEGENQLGSCLTGDVVEANGGDFVHDFRIPSRPTSSRQLARFPLFGPS